MAYRGQLSLSCLRSEREHQSAPQHVKETDFRNCAAYYHHRLLSSWLPSDGACGCRFIIRVSDPAYGRACLEPSILLRYYSCRHLLYHSLSYGLYCLRGVQRALRQGVSIDS